ncbi:hypothetical protein HPB48_006590 [Haemaphysalis longicornis]|uniref:Acetylcholine receptor subunit beta-like 1 n=1 Tax=Haemaphysalis longicornis TaxID=44386 RepID=A0A9J6GNY2_HAELO|nr:hypothetical protein HPB48_006590 [Haemaphysalis longicornis]
MPGKSEPLGSLGTYAEKRTKHALLQDRTWNDNVASLKSIATDCRKKLFDSLKGRRYERVTPILEPFFSKSGCRRRRRSSSSSGGSSSRAADYRRLCEEAAPAEEQGEASLGRCRCGPPWGPAMGAAGRWAAAPRRAPPPANRHVDRAVRRLPRPAMTAACTILLLALRLAPGERRREAGLVARPKDRGHWRGAVDPLPHRTRPRGPRARWGPPRGLREARGRRWPPSELAAGAPTRPCHRRTGARAADMASVRPKNTLRWRRARACARPRAVSRRGKLVRPGHTPRCGERQSTEKGARERNEKNQIMTSNVWLQLVWTDYQLKWDEADYGGIAVLRLPPDKVWKPDIVLFNNADGNYEVRYKSNVLIYPSGQVMWVPPAIYQSSCTIDVTYFPFDQQKCVMKFGSWTFNGDQVSLKLYNNNFWVDLSDYWKSGTWDIVEVPAFLNRHNNSKQQRPTETDISFYITIRRKTLFYTVNLILPTVLISFLCILVFYLPAEAGEKVTLGISILLSLVVFLLLVSKILPPTSLVLPLIAKYLLFTFLMNTMSILVTVIIINWNFRGPRTHRMPNWIRVLFLKYLPAMLLMKRPHKTRLRWMMEMPGAFVSAFTALDRQTVVRGPVPELLLQPRKKYSLAFSFQPSHC